jgi:hypothetical protein
MIRHEKSEKESTEEEQEKKHKASIDGWTLSIAAIVAAFTGLLVIIGWRGVRAARDTLTAIQGQLAEIQSAGQQTNRLIAHAETQAQAALGQVRISELAMIANNRAYVHHDGFRWISHPDPNGKLFWRIRPSWRNTGNTPTRKLRIYIGYELRDYPLPADFSFSVPDDVSMPVVTLESKGRVESVPYDLWADDLLSTSEGKKFFWVWGVASYRDIFPGTPEHITRFCVHITNVSGNPRRPYSESDNVVDIRFQTYDKNNCCDEECDQLPT